MVFPQKFRLCNALKETLSRDGEGKRGDRRGKNEIPISECRAKSSEVVPGPISMFLELVSI